MKDRLVLPSLCLLAVCGLAACSNQPAASSTPASETPGTAAPMAADAGARTVSGTVAETMDAANYTYMRVNTGEEDVWVAASHFEVKVGDRVVVPLEMPMTDFHSQTLNRDFPLIYFVSRVAREGEPLPGVAAGEPRAPGGMPMPMGSHPPRADVPPVQEVIAQPSGGSTVASVWANRASLAGRTVTVRGKIVKFNGGIMDRNWLHVQDGTGSVDDRTNDLTITTAADAKVGDIVTATGTIAIDKDFGAGYTYPVILENATLHPAPKE